MVTYHSTSNDIFSIWVASDATTSTTADTWYIWNTTSATTSAITTTDNSNIYIKWVEEHAASVEEIIRREHAAKRARLQAIREQRRKRIKELRAKRLLKQHLDEEQLKMLADKDHFYVRAHSGKLYRIRKGRSGNVEQMHDDSERVHKVLCAHPNVYCPNYDTMLAQKLMLETDEAAFLAVANVHRTFH